jgi:hypothetical protein
LARLGDIPKVRFQRIEGVFGKLETSKWNEGKVHLGAQWCSRITERDMVPMK